MARKEQFSVGILTAESLTVSGDVAINDDLTVADDAAIGGDAAVTGALAVTGNTSLTGDVAVTGTLSIGNGNVKVAVTAAGGNIAAGDLVCVTGYDATGGRLVVGKADCDATVKGQRVAQFFAPAAITAGALGYVYGCGTLTGVDTSSASAVGDPVYLSDTAGGWSLSAPSTAGDIIQQVGVVTVDHATTGAIAFFPFYSKPVTYVS